MGYCIPVIHSQTMDTLLQMNPLSFASKKIKKKKKLTLNIRVVYYSLQCQIIKLEVKSSPQFSRHGNANVTEWTRTSSQFLDYALCRHKQHLAHIRFGHPIHTHGAWCFQPSVTGSVDLCRRAPFSIKRTHSKILACNRAQ